jgi:2-hydroxychromene-2-carboxylate isomerase
MQIDVISDVVCPWCYIGKRNLESALASWRQMHPDEAAPEVRWHPFQLNPHLPESGVSRREYLEQKFGGPERAKEIYARVTAAGSRSGIAFDFDSIRVQPNTINPHRLIHIAADRGSQDEMAEALFRNYFLEAADLTQKGTLADIAAQAGRSRPGRQPRRRRGPRADRGTGPARPFDRRRRRTVFHLRPALCAFRRAAAGSDAGRHGESPRGPCGSTAVNALSFAACVW